MGIEKLSTSSSSSSSRSIILSKFNTVYRHSILDILTFYTDIPTDPNPDNNPLSIRDPNDSLNNITIAPIKLNPLKTSKDSKDSISNVKLKDINFNEIIISFKHSIIELEILRPIKFDSKCSNWKQVEEKLIKMSKISANARNLSNLRVSGISYPISIFNILILFSVSLLPIGYFYNDFLYDNIFKNFIPIMLYFKPFHNYIFLTTIFIHLLEFYIFLVPRIKKFRVPTDYAIEWSILTFLDGYESIKRFDNYVETIKPDDIYYDFTNNEYFL